MKISNKLNLVFSFLIFALYPPAIMAGVALPTSAPIDVFPSDKYEGYGVTSMKIVLDLKDEGYQFIGVDQLEIGKVDFDVQGLIYKNSTSDGGKFEHSYTIGQVKGELKNKQFTGDIGTYNNSYNQSGFFVGYIPAYSTELFTSASKSLDIKYAYSLNTMLFFIDGDYSINVTSGAVTGGSYSVAYDESNLGLAFKPTAVIQPTWYFTNDVAFTIYGGATAFLEVNYNTYENKANSSDSDSEFVGSAKAIKLLYGYDLSIRGIFGKNDIFNLSAAFAGNTDDEEDLSEIVVVYKIPILE